MATCDKGSSDGHAACALTLSHFLTLPRERETERETGDMGTRGEREIVSVGGERDRETPTCREEEEKKEGEAPDTKTRKSRGGKERKKIGAVGGGRAGSGRKQGE